MIFCFLRFQAPSVRWFPHLYFHSIFGVWALVSSPQARIPDWNLDAPLPAYEIKDEFDRLSIHLDGQFTVVYSKTSCSLIQAWKSPIEKTGIDEAWYRPPASVVYHQSEKAVWSVLIDGKPILVRAIFSYPTLGANAIHFRIRLLLRNGKEISVVETPHYDAHYGAPRLMRNIEVTGLSENEEVRLQLSEPHNHGFWRLSGGGKFEQQQGQTTLIVSRDGFSQALTVWQ